MNRLATINYPPGVARARTRTRGFTLIEVLVVLAIMALLGVLIVFSPGLSRANNLTAAGNMVTNDIAYARELAIANNQKTAVWFLQPSGGTFLTALQIYTYDQNGVATSYGPVHHLPAEVGLDSGTLLSPLFASGNKLTWTLPNVQPTIPSFPSGYNAWSIGFMPDGSTTASQTWYFTLHDIKFGNQLPVLPANYAVVSIDYVTGAVSLYRP